MRASNPALITVALSAAAVLGYVTYRLTLGDAPNADAAAQHGAHDAHSAGSSLPNELPEFALANLEGEQQSIRSWPGQPLVINFWATWCAPCLREIPMLKAFQDSHPELTVVGIAVDTVDEVEPFAADMGFNYPIMIGRTEAVNAAASFGVEFYALPFTIFTDAEGRTLGVRTGEIHQEHLDELVAVLEDLDSGGTDLEEARMRIAGFR